MNATWVAKLGGSLLDPPDLPDLVTRLESVLGHRGGDRPILVVGGGQGVDLVRRWDRLFGIGEEASHWIAVRALSINARIVERVLPRGIVVETRKACEAAWSNRHVPIYDCFAFLKGIDEHGEDPLPRAWKVTSDSLAARIAEHFGAAELALLKSASLPELVTIADAVEQGYVDGYFQTAAARLSVRVAINLRQENAPVSRMV